MRLPRRTCTLAALTCALGIALGLAPSPSHAAPVEGATERATALGTTKIEGDQYLIQITPPELRVGAPGALVVTIEGKAGFHFNRDFPTKLELGTAPEGLDFPKPVLKRADGTLDEAGKIFTLKAPMTAKRAGEFALEPTLKFSVCSEDKCVVQRQTLRTKVEAK
jgi:hypothetical protein